MTVLTDAERNQVRRAFAKYISDRNVEYGVDIGNTRNAVDSTDNWIDTEEPNFVANLPEPFKSSTDAELKTVLFMLVLARRRGLDSMNKLVGGDF